VDKRLLVRFPRVIAVSGQIRAELLARGARPDQVVTVLNGIDHEAFRRDPARVPAARAALGLGPEDLAVGAVGRLEPQKRFDLLIAACRDLHARYPRLRLLIAGDGSQRAALDAAAAASGMGAACRLLGHRADIPALHHAFDLFVQSSDYEGTPNAVLEAMAFETPLVATDVGGTSELAADGLHGRILPPGDAGRLAAAIEAALADMPAMRRMAAAARGRVEGELSFARRTDTLNRIYGDLIAARGSAT
jgi:glycosyltransferase involved in cell wall biosynthesis